jgi:hypothetical protein
MKKIIIATALIFTAGILASCNKTTGIKTSTTIMLRSFSDRKDLGSGD